jgi:two-component system invasion response regulator UvrY
MLRVLVADDHAVVREGLKGILSEEFGQVSFGEACDGQELMGAIQKQEWDILILDITMPGKSGLDALKEIRQIRPKLPVLVLSMHPEDQFAVRMLKAGAAGYMTKEKAPEELISAIKKALAGGKYISSSLAETLAFNLEEEGEKAPHALLSDREYEVLCMIASGKTVGEIADILYLSVKTVSTYRARILEKMKMRTNAELTHYAIKNHLVE